MSARHSTARTSCPTSTNTLGLRRARYTSRVDRAFFEYWTPHLAWLIGLIWTDGCLVGNTITISAKGKQIPETVQLLVGKDVPILEKHGKPGCYQISFTEWQVTDFLCSLGLTPAKSRTIEWPSIPSELEPDFVRGVLDGDGWVSKSTKRRAVGFCGASMAFGRSLSDWLNAQGITHRVEYAEPQDLFTARMWKLLINRVESLAKLHDLIYAEPDYPAHEAKRQRYAAILSYIETNGIKSRGRRPAKVTGF